MSPFLLCYTSWAGKRDSSRESLDPDRRALQIADRQGAVAAGWPENELIGDRIIVPPATNEKDAKARPGEYERFDRWFCHKPPER